MSSESQIAELTSCKNTSRLYLKSLSPEAKIAHLMVLQERYYEMLSVRAAKGGRPIPTKWKKWYTARHGWKFTMNVDLLLPILIVAAILLSSLVCVYFSLRLQGWKQKGRILSAIVIWFVWFIFGCATYIGFLWFCGPPKYTSSMSRLYLEFVGLLFVGFGGLFSVFVTTRILQQRELKKETSLFESLEATSTSSVTLHKAFFINLAAIVGFGASLAVAILIDDIYFNRFSDSKQKICSEEGICFTIYD